MLTPGGSSTVHIYTQTTQTATQRDRTHRTENRIPRNVVPRCMKRLSLSDFFRMRHLTFSFKYVKFATFLGDFLALCAVGYMTAYHLQTLPSELPTYHPR
jgi:hypothetical protein